MIDMQKAIETGKSHAGTWGTSDCMTNVEFTFSASELLAAFQQVEREAISALSHSAAEPVASDAELERLLNDFALASMKAVNEAPSNASHEAREALRAYVRSLQALAGAKELRKVFDATDESPAIHKDGCGKLVAGKRFDSAPQAPSQQLTSEVPTSGNWIAADDVKRLVRELDVALNGEEGAAQQASLCDIVAQVKCGGWRLVPVSADPALPLVPTITSEMKAAHIGEYVIKRTVPCPGPDADGCEGDDCHLCDGDATITINEFVPWDTCKQIFKGMYATYVASLPQAPGTVVPEGMVMVPRNLPFYAETKLFEEWARGEGWTDFAQMHGCRYKDQRLNDQWVGFFSGVRALQQSALSSPSTMSSDGGGNV